MSFLEALFSSSPRSSAANIKTVLDLVTYMAGLASNPDDIDPILDKVRSITAHLGSDEKPSAAHNQILLGVYLQIEEYLTTKERIRNFTRDGLRSRFSPQLRAELNNYETNKRS